MDALISDVELDRTEGAQHVSDSAISCAEFEALIVEAVAKALEVGQHRPFDGHAATCQACSSHLAAYRLTVAATQRLRTQPATAAPERLIAAILDDAKRIAARSKT